MLQLRAMMREYMTGKILHKNMQSLHISKMLVHVCKLYVYIIKHYVVQISDHDCVL